ncbi:4 TMS phage holin, superfamily IV [Nocardioides alpinus]|uniref:4 TMS phage holin, superfamily IV n=1 Tax=Nocardioides alpinus TaxID=748909 RepID=A0A1I1AW86_9ACTN|nr:phage holin family protein [Nocardioides alpinus]PKH40953.1 phosphodiesterase [Nocardioides alpinus]SFB42345.1 4 TMS phage holin, superfamily IV [Nocardioides alpinus]
MAAPRVRSHLGAGDGARLLVAWLASAGSLGVAAWLLPGLEVDSFRSLLLASAVTGVVGLLVRPALVRVTAYVGWIAVLLAGLLGQALVTYVALQLVPGVSTTVSAAVAAAWIVAATGSAVAWLGIAGTDDAFVSALVRRLPPAATVEDPDVDGIVFVQADGVPFPVLQWAIQAGATPTMRRWVTGGTHVLREWTPQLPCTTPASQLGILHGTVDRVPAFRWYDRELGRLLVANRPADAAVIEARASDGRGLLADDGLSVSNLFTGDAPRWFLTMSRARVARGSAHNRRTVAGFLADPQGLMRGLVHTVAEIAKERFQARGQVRRDLTPRVHRGWTFAGLRAVTNVLMRDLNTSIVAEEMRRGRRSIYVDYVDYDEIAHHAGMFRPESLAALDGVDRVLGTLERLAATAPRRYHFVVLSDHGQSQGQPFAERHGTDLAGLCARLMEEQVESVDAPVEGWGRADAVAEEMAAPGIKGHLAGRAADVTRRHLGDEREDDQRGAPAVSVLGSGNLGLLYVHGPTRLTLDELSLRWPDLIPGVSNHAGIGFVAGIDVAGRPWAIGRTGRIALDSLEVEGTDPMAAYGEHAARVLRRAVLMPEAPDLYVNSTVDEGTLDIAAFEPLVGAHGGLGGWQDRAMFLVPRELLGSLPEGRIEGADHLHRVLVGMLTSLGHRDGIDL